MHCRRALYLIGSGLPSIRSVVGKSKTYAERMFNYEEIGALDFEATQNAIVRPLAVEKISIEPAVLTEVYRQTGAILISCRNGGISFG